MTPHPDSTASRPGSPRRSGGVGRTAWRALGWLLLSAWAAGTAGPSTRAHDRLRELLTQEFQLEVGRTNIDLIVELTFQEAPSYAERRRIDTNRNGRVEPSEVREYLRGLTPELEDGLELKFAAEPGSPGIRIPLSLLHNPELDLRDNPVVGLASQVLRLRLFARTPAALRDGGRLVLISRLWAHVPASRSARITGRDGYEFDVEDKPPSTPASARSRKSAQDPEPLRFRCRAAPGGPGDLGKPESVAAAHAAPSTPLSP